MLRRDFVRAAVSVSIAPGFLCAQQSANPAPPPPAPVPWTLGLNPKTPLPHTEVSDQLVDTEMLFFTPQQTATLIRLCDVLLPPIGNKPGALQAGTPAFLDFLIGSSSDIRKQMYTSGLDWLDAQTQQRLHLPFSKVNNAQADAMLKPWLQSWMSDHPPVEEHAEFVNIAHDDIRTATVNSKAWSDIPSLRAQASPTVGLYWSPIEPDLSQESFGCMRIPAHVTAGTKASHPTPSFPQ